MDVEGPRQSRRGWWRRVLTGASRFRFAVEAHGYGIGACGEQI